jgi:hypothetical protein
MILDEAITYSLALQKETRQKRLVFDLAGADQACAERCFVLARLGIGETAKVKQTKIAFAFLYARA